MHVTDGVHGDKGADSRDEQEHDAGKSVEQEPDIRPEQGNINPVAEGFPEPGLGHAAGKDCHHGKRERREQHRKSPDETFGRALLSARRNHGDGSQKDSTDQGEKRNKPKW